MHNGWLVPDKAPFARGGFGSDSPQLFGPSNISHLPGIFMRSEPPVRQRTNQACEKCRERKAKCTGSRPSCKRCLERGLICEYSTESRSRGLPRKRLSTQEDVVHHKPRSFGNEAKRTSIASTNSAETSDSPLPSSSNSSSPHAFLGQTLQSVSTKTKELVGIEAPIYPQAMAELPPFTFPPGVITANRELRTEPALGLTLFNHADDKITHPNSPFSDRRLRDSLHQSSTAHVHPLDIPPNLRYRASMPQLPQHSASHSPTQQPFSQSSRALQVPPPHFSLLPAQFSQHPKSSFADSGDEEVESSLGMTLESSLAAYQFPAQAPPQGTYASPQPGPRDVISNQVWETESDTAYPNQLTPPQNLALWSPAQISPLSHSPSRQDHVSRLSRHRLTQSLSTIPSSPRDSAFPSVWDNLSSSESPWHPHPQQSTTGDTFDLHDQSDVLGQEARYAATSAVRHPDAFQSPTPHQAGRLPTFSPPSSTRAVPHSNLLLLPSDPSDSCEQGNERENGSCNYEDSRRGSSWWL